MQRRRTQALQRVAEHRNVLRVPEPAVPALHAARRVQISVSSLAVHPITGEVAPKPLRGQKSPGIFALSGGSDLIDQRPARA